VLAIIPVNSPSSGKRRLQSLLPAEQRARLVRAMLADVIEACKQAQLVNEVLVVTPEPSLAPFGVEVLGDAGAGHAAAIASALNDPRAAAGALVLMADCPLVRPETLDLLIDEARPLSLCPAQDGGTNALVLRPANVLEPAFGVPDSAAVTIERARRLGIKTAVVDDPLVALDVDRPDDLPRILELGRGTCTHAYLDQTPFVSAEFGARLA
jgi:2-phospho-L-lactate/phosphoenolpyruvate guanylyltransferase